jgi:hypothetical protein
MPVSVEPCETGRDLLRSLQRPSNFSHSEPRCVLPRIHQSSRSLRDRLVALIFLLAAPILGSFRVFGPTTLYNGITLPAAWPPTRTPTQESHVPPYVFNPPAVIPIGLGRQLFVDDFLIQQTTLMRTAHRPVMYPNNPVLSPGGPDLKGVAFPYSDGVWYDPADHLFKMWYLGSYGNMVSYAYSTDGKSWIKPSLPDAVVPGTNTVLQIGGQRDSDTIWMDLDDPDPARKFKAFAVAYPPVINIYFSSDGIHWSGPQTQTINSVSDRTTVFWNPFRKVWVDSARYNATLPATATAPSHYGRVRYYSESPDLVNWFPANPLNAFWSGPDEKDPPYAGSGGALPELYNLDAVAYESVLVGLFSWFNPGPAYGPSYAAGPDLVELGVGFSRDGFNWVRPTRGGGANAFIPASNVPGTWNAYNTQSAGGGFLVVGDELWFYFSGRTLQKPASGVGSAGLAILRRDGFYSMDAGASEGVLTTRTVQFTGKYLFVNARDPQGALQVEVLDRNGNVIAPFSKQNCAVVSADTTLRQVSWNGVSDLSSLAGTPVQLRFYLTNGELYSFWVTGDASGASHGYVAAGGPGFTTNTDTVGSRNVSTGPATRRERPGTSDRVVGHAALTPTERIATSMVRQHYVAPDGRSSGSGEIQDPWDLQTALNHPPSVRPGDVLWLRNGVYGSGATVFTSNLKGTNTEPILVRQFRGERATISGQLKVQGSNTWFWGFELANTTIQNRISNQGGSWSAPPGFLEGIVVFGPGSKFINLIVHDTAEGFSFWTPAQDSEIYGSLIYNNGWMGTDRGHGHGIYTQNRYGLKIVADNVIFQGFGLGIHCYGSSAAYIENYIFDGNTIFNSGTLVSRGTHDYNFLVTGGHGPKNITVTNNYTYHTPSDSSGASALDWSTDVQASKLIATSNYWIGGQVAIELFNWHDATFKYNTTHSSEGYSLMVANLEPQTYEWANNTYYGAGRFSIDRKDERFTEWQAATGLDRDSKYIPGRPTGTWVFVRPNRYEPGRANITIYNWGLADVVPVDVSNVLKVGESFEVRNAQDFFAAPVLSGTYLGGTLSIPMRGLTVARPQGAVPNLPKAVGPEFGAFVLLPGVSPDGGLAKSPRQASKGR